jgi:hypothetical protein
LSLAVAALTVDLAVLGDDNEFADVEVVAAVVDDVGDVVGVVVVVALLVAVIAVVVVTVVAVPVIICAPAGAGSVASAAFNALRKCDASSARENRTSMMLGCAVMCDHARARTRAITRTTSARAHTKARTALTLPLSSGTISRTIRMLSNDTRVTH